MPLNKRVPHPDCLAKYAAAFFRMSRSSVTRLSSAFSRRTSSVCDRKGQQWYFGMKLHIGVDSQTGLSHSAVVTAANVHDKHPLPDLLHGNEQRVYGDSAYASQKALIASKAPRAKDFTNLLSNALRHTEMAGEVRIEISDTENSTKVSVENTGDGIDPKILPRLFDRFYRADPSRAQPDSDGTGLGLAITRAIVEAHGGKIEVSSAQGLTRFTLEFIKVSQA